MYRVSHLGLGPAGWDSHAQAPRSLVQVQLSSRTLDNDSLPLLKIRNYFSKFKYVIFINYEKIFR